MATHSSISPWGHKEWDTTEQLSTAQQTLAHSQMEGRWSCYSHAFWETDSLRRTMQIVECSLLQQRAPGRVSSWPRTMTDFCENLIYLKCTAQANIPKFLKPSLESIKGRFNQAAAMIHNQKGQLVIHCGLHQGVPSRLQR